MHNSGDMRAGLLVFGRPVFGNAKGLRESHAETITEAFGVLRFENAKPSNYSEIPNS